MSHHAEARREWGEQREMGEMEGNLSRVEVINALATNICEAEDSRQLWGIKILGLSFSHQFVSLVSVCLSLIRLQNGSL